MALTSCPECGGNVSTSAEACPHCGFQLTRVLHQPAPAHVTPATNPSVTSAVPAPPRNAVRGWLALFGVGCFFGGFLSLAGITEWSDIPPGDWVALVSAVPTVSGLRTFSYFYAVASAAGLWWIFYLLIRPRHSTAVWAVVVLAVLLLLGVVNWLWSEAFASQLDQALRASGDTTGFEDSTLRADLLRPVGWTLIWLWYLFRSKRVRNTFGEVSVQRIRAWVSSRGQYFSGRVSGAT